MQRILLALLIMTCSIVTIHAQTMEDLLSQQAEKNGMIADLQAQIDAAQGEVTAIQKEIDVLSGWRKGITGMVGFDWNKSSGWVANPNPESQAMSLGIDLSAYLMNDRDQTFWHNKLSVVKGWTDVDQSQADIDDENDGLFKNGTIDILNLSSLAGYKISDQFALSGQAELNTSLGNFLKPGTFDIGIGATWLPIENMTVMIHPLNYNIAFPADGTAFKTSGSLGAKFRLDYFNDFIVLDKNVNWTTTLTSFIPYTSLDPITLDDGTILSPKVNNYTWINNFSFDVWRGIGVGIGWGLRKADFESDKTQSYYTIGLSYKVK